MNSGTKLHDYDPEWDYEKDVRPKRNMRDAFEKARSDILRENLLAKEKAAFRNFTLFYAVDVGQNEMGKYVDGTQSAPVIIVDLAVCNRACREYDVEPYVAARSTILHELKHAIQEAEGSEYNEDDAEDFAKRNTQL